MFICVLFSPDGERRCLCKSEKVKDCPPNSRCELVVRRFEKEHKLSRLKPICMIVPYPNFISNIAQTKNITAF